MTGSLDATNAMTQKRIETGYREVMGLVKKSRIGDQRGFSVPDLLNAMVLIAVLLGMGALLGQRAIAKYQLNAAAHMLVVDMSRVKTEAIQTNSVTSIDLRSERDYRASGMPRRLPLMVRFDDASADTVPFNGLGGVADGSTRRLVLTTRFGDSREIFVYAAGGQEVRKL